MAMKDLGKKSSQLYDSPGTVQSEKNRIIYPEINLPLDFIEGLKLEVDDNISFVAKGRISGMEDTRYAKRVSLELKKGEIVKDGKDKQSILDEA